MKNKRAMPVLIILLLLVAIIIVILAFNLFGTRPAEEEVAATAPPEKDVAKTATVVVSGTGQDMYYVFDETGDEKLDFAYTNKEIQLPPGRYTVSLHDISQTITPRDGKKVVLESGTLAVSGIGRDMYYVFDAKGEERLDSSYTNKEIELFPGTYTVFLNGISQTAEVKANGRTYLLSGTLAISGVEKGLYYVYDSTGKKKLDFRGVDRKIELFPGQYVVTIKEKKFPAEIKPNEETTLTP